MHHLIHAGDSKRAAAARITYAVRRDRYGPAGVTPDGLARIRAAHLRGPWKTHCTHGHKYTAANTYSPPRTPHKRRCQACRIVARHRGRWDALQRAKLAALKRAMIRAHPDMGGTVSKFVRARRVYLAARAAATHARRRAS